MNNSDILALAYDLKDKIIESDLYKDLKDKEKKMLEDEECSKLLSAFQIAKDEYKEAKRFEKYGSNVEIVQKRISELKYELDENELVKEYNLAYKRMKKKLKEIGKNIFKDIIEEKREIKIEE